MHIDDLWHMIDIMQKPFFDFLNKIPHRIVSFAAKKRVAGLDSPVDSLFVVKSGLVHLVRFQEDGGMVVLQRVGAGAIMAEASVFADSYHCAAVAVLDSKVLAYPIKSVRRMLVQNPEATLAYARHLAGEMREARKRAEVMALKTVAERLSAWLIWNQGDIPPKGERHHLADEIGVSREALYRELAKRK